MTYQEFKDAVCESLRSSLPNDTTVAVSTVTKNNDTHLDGLLIRSPSCNISPTLYLNHYYDRLLDGENLECLVSEILNVYLNNKPSDPIDSSFFTDYERVKHRIAFKLIHREKNKELLSDVPFIPFLDFAVVFYCLLSSEGGCNASILIRTNHLDFWNVSKEDLFDLARQNTPVLLPVFVKSMAELLCESYPQMQEAIDACEKPKPMVVISNEKQLFGAAAILYPGMLCQIANQFENDLIVLPSSIHEVIVLPADDSVKTAAYNTMIREVNDTQVAPEEVLSDHAYFFSRRENKLSIA